MRSVRRALIPMVVLAVVMSADVRVASACPNCKDSVASATTGDGSSGTATSTNPGGGLPSGFNISIYLMLTAFLGVLGFVGYTLYRAANPAPARRGFAVVARTR